MMHGIARDLERTTHRSEENADCKHAREQPFLIDAERCDHIAVLRRRAYQHAPACALEQKPENAEHHRAEHDQEQIIARDVLAEEINRPPEAGRAAADEIIGTPDQHDEVLDHQGQAEGREQLEQFGCVIDAPEQHHLDNDTDHRHDKRCHDDPAPEAERPRQALGERECDIGADHVEGAVREIHDPRHAKDDRQARRHQEQRCCAGETGQKLYDVKGHWRSGLSVSLGIGATSFETALRASSG
ncbi:hypothetical protein ACVWWK_006265 [Bradyrhizobium sp. LB9.1b]